MDVNNSSSTFSYAIINNIPAEYHSKDLRNYFSQFIESNGFEIFHFRHRPEVQMSSKDTTTQSQNESHQSRSKQCTCCVIKLPCRKVKTFFSMYNRKHWIDNSGNVMTRLCFITRIKLPEESGENQLLTRGEQRLIPTDRETFTIKDLTSLPELRPPDVMPHGNVGTPTMVFMDFIKQCRLPPSIIKKLGLSFPKVRTNKMYGNVHFDYGETVERGNKEDEDIHVYSANGHELIPEGDELEKHLDEADQSEKRSSLLQPDGKRKKRRKKMDRGMKERMDLRIEEKMMQEEDVSDGDNDSCEEWERHEALYDDPSNQERNKERLFEEEIELKWEKGGSGLVFYTDAQYWQEQEGDFDEQTVDDWDVDMSGFYEEGAGDKDARDYLAIRQEKRRRDGIEHTDRFTAGIASKTAESKRNADKYKETIGKFEAHTKGIGRKILEGQGWSEGQGLGSTIQGMKDALDNEGQTPRDRRGFGYHGEKLNRHLPKAQRKVIISTVFDNPRETDPHEPLHRRHEPYHLKYRDEVLFEKSNETLNL